MHWVDWSIIAAYVVLITVIGLAFARRAGSSTSEFFIAGRNLPWWIAGTSLVATSFAADTPLAITGIVADKGIAGNWLWWNQVVAWALAMVFFARLWRRSGIMTDAEFIELRYGGRAGAFLRGFKAFYSSVIFSTYTLAWVMLGMQKIIGATIPAPDWVGVQQIELEHALGLAAGSVDLWKWIVLMGLFAATTLYAVLAGAWGIVITDLIQCTMAMGGSLMFAIYAVRAAGGMATLHAKLASLYGAERTANFFSFFPAADSPWMPVTTFAVYLGVLWWGDCGGFAAMRMFSTRSERDSVLTAVWYSILHFAVRPWPWIAVALVTLVFYPDLKDREAGYPMLMMQILPTGLLGLMMASLVAAFMSTADTHLNWNASYFVNDMYKRFLKPEATERQCVRMSRLSTVVFAGLAIVLAYFMTNISDAWIVLFNLQAGIGLVIMLRWFWWRINAWSEMSAMVASLVVTTVLHYLAKAEVIHWSPAARIVATVVFCTPVWVAVTFLTAPATPEALANFYRRVRPQRTLWGPVARACPEVVSTGEMGACLINWIFSAVALYAGMITIGKLVMGARGEAAIALTIASLACGLIWIRSRNRRASIET